MRKCSTSFHISITVCPRRNDKALVSLTTLLKETDMQSLKKVCGIPVGLILILMGLLPSAEGQVSLVPVQGPQRAAEKTEKTVGPFTGTVLDAAGKPVTGVKVLLLSFEGRDDVRIVAETASDEKGRFQIAKQKWDDLAGHPRPWFLTARDAKGRMGGQLHHYNRPAQGAAAQQFENLEIRLQEVNDCQGRLVDSAGQPISKATIRPTSWSQQHTEEMYSVNIIFPAQWGSDLAAQSDADGHFTLRNVPIEGRISAKVRAEGFGEPWANWNLDKPANLKLNRVGAIRGAVTCEKDPKTVAGLKLRLLGGGMRTYSSRAVDPLVSYSAEGTTQKDGAFYFDNVPAGQYHVMPELPAAAPYYSEGLRLMEVRPGETATLSLAIKPAVAVRGKVLDQQTGQGVAGVQVSLAHRMDSGGGGDYKSATTSADGTFTLFARPGKANVYFQQVPDQYANPSNSRQNKVIDIQNETTLDPIRLERVNVLEGVVVDTSGKPVAGAEIRCTDTEYGFSLQEVFHSDAAGKFTLKKISPKKTYIVRVRTDRAVADPANVVPAELKGPLRMVVNEKTAYTLRGTVTDEAGKPIPQAQVGLIAHWHWGSGGVSFVSDNRKTDDQGRFEFGGLWPGDEYQIRIQAKDCVSFGSPQMKATPGDTHDFGKIALASANAVVEGRVLDSAGKPVADARVFNSGDGIAPMETRSDGSGRFRLQGFRKGPVFVFAEKEGYRFAGLRTNSGAADAALKMLKTTEPAPAAIGVLRVLVRARATQGRETIAGEALDVGQGQQSALGLLQNGPSRSQACPQVGHSSRVCSRQSSEPGFDQEVGRGRLGRGR